MLPQSIIDKILAKFGKERIYSGDCAALAGEIGVSDTTVKRMLGLVGEDSPERKRIPHVSTMDILSRWLGYEDYHALLQEIGEGTSTSEFTEMQTIEIADLEEGAQIRLRYEPARMILMTYLGDGRFLVDESKNSKLIAGDRLRLTHLVLGQELIVSEVVRDNRSLGSYRAAKDGGLTLIEIIS